MLATVCNLGLDGIVTKHLMRPAIKSVPQLAPNGLNQVFKPHVITPASLNGDINAAPKCVSGAVIFSAKDFFGRYRSHVLFGHARISRRPEDDRHRGAQI
jgi:hypothetical protein